MNQPYLFVFLLLLLTAPALRAQSLNETYLSLQEAIREKPGDPDLKMDLAYLFSQGREMERAIALYEEVLAAHPGNVRAVTELCVLRTEIRDENRALEFCQKAVSLQPGDLLALDNLGLSYFKFGRFREALKPFSQAAALDTQNVLVRTHMAQTFLALGEYQAARAYLEELKERATAPEDKFLIYNGLSTAYRELKDYDRAFTATLETYKLAQNPLFLGKVTTAFLRAHQVGAFFAVAAVILAGSRYLGARLNRFLKNEA